MDIQVPTQQTFLPETLVFERNKMAEDETDKYFVLILTNISNVTRPFEGLKLIGLCEMFLHFIKPQLCQSLICRYHIT